MKYSYRTEGTCCQAFDIETEDGKIKDVQFYGGCNGNLQGICSLIKGMPIGDVIGKLQGIRCGYIVSGSAQPCPLADCGEGRKRGKIAEKKRETVKKAIENQPTVGFLSLFLLYLHRYEECIDTITKYSCDISVHCVSLSKGED